MAEIWQGPGTAYIVHFEADGGPGIGLPPEVQAIYGQWDLPSFADRPYVYANFVISHDGRVSFNTPDALTSWPVSRSAPHDQWLMGLLRARADAILVGDTTLRMEADHLFIAEAIYPADAERYAALRLRENRAPLPIFVFASYDGNIVPNAAVFDLPGARVLIASTTAGIVRAREILGQRSNIGYLPLGSEQVDLAALTTILYREHGVRTLLCEGGPTLYGSMVAAGQIDDEFLTISPLLIGEPRGGRRPSLVEGVGYDPTTPPMSTLLSLRQAGNYLFLRSRYR